STAPEFIPKRKKIAVKSSAAGSKPKTKSKSPKAKKLGKSPNLKVSNKSKTQPLKNTQTSTSQNNNTNSVDHDHSDDDSNDFEVTSSGSCRRPVKKTNPTNSVDHDNRDDDSNDFEGTSSGSFRKPVKKSKTIGSPPLLRISRSLFNANKSSDHIQNNNDEDKVANHSSIEQEEGQVLIKSMRNGIHTAVQTDQPEATIVCEPGIQTESEVITRTISTFHHNVHKLIGKILPEMDIGDVCDIESMVLNMIREDTPEDSEEDISENFLHL
ncbi:unnamed protein product, partial [Lymnaea stagnalis]